MSENETDAPRWQGWGSRLLPVLTFLVGLALGLVVMLATGDDAEPAPEAEPTPTPSASADGNGDTVVTVPGACEDASENITEATRLLDDVAGSVRDFRPEELVDLLNRLEDIDRETRGLARECSGVSVTEGASPTDEVEPSESAEPTG